jgi:hypothetical protein
MTISNGTVIQIDLVSIQAGDTMVITVPVTNMAGSAVNLNGAAIVYTIKDNLGNAKVTHTLATTGIAVVGSSADGIYAITIAPADTLTTYAIPGTQYTHEAVVTIGGVVRHSWKGPFQVLP